MVPVDILPGALGRFVFSQAIPTTGLTIEAYRTTGGNVSIAINGATITVVRALISELAPEEFRVLVLTPDRLDGARGCSR